MIHGPGQHDIFDWLVVGTFFIFHNIWDNPSHWLSYFSRWLKPPASWFPPASLIIGWWLSQANLRRSWIHPKHCRWRRPRGTRAPYITMVVTNAKETWHVRIGIAEVWRYSIHMGLNVGSPNDIGQVLNGKKKIIPAHNNDPANVNILGIILNPNTS